VNILNRGDKTPIELFVAAAFTIDTALMKQLTSEAPSVAVQPAVAPHNRRI
jgi:hypothetical protein